MKKRTPYPLDYKLRIIEEAKVSGNNYATARTHGLSEKQVRCWRKDEMKIRAGLSTGRMFRLEGAGKRSSSSKHEPQIQDPNNPNKE